MKEKEEVIIRRGEGQHLDGILLPHAYKRKDGVKEHIRERI
jgi:hypothetical protein